MTLMDNALQTIPTGLDLAPPTWAMLKEQASMLVKSGFLPPALNTPEKVIAVALKGRELGVPMMEALSKIDIIQGKPAVAPQLMLALALRTGQVEEHSMESNDQKAVFTIKRKGMAKPFVGEFGVKEATGLGLMSRDNYRKQPRTMFEWRAIAKALRFAFPDAISGLYTPDELGVDINDDTEGDRAPKPKIQMPRAKTSAPEPQRMDAVPTTAVEVAPESVPLSDDHPEHPGPATGPSGDELPFDGQTADEPSESLRKKFYATIREKDLAEKVKNWCKMVYGKTSSKELSAKQMSEILELIESGGIREDAKSE